MSQEGRKGLKESGSSSADTLSSRSGKRLRDGKEEVPGAKARDLDLHGAVENMREGQTTSDENVGKRIKCDSQSSDVSLKVVANVSNKDQALALEVEEDTPFFCRVCCVNCTSKKDYNTHISGKRHARAVSGVVTPHSGKVFKKSGMSSKAEVSPVSVHEDVLITQQPVVDGSIANVDQARKVFISNSTGCTDMEGAEAVRSPEKNGSKGMVVKQQDLKEGMFMESLGSQLLKNGSTCKFPLHDQGNENFVQPLTNGHHVHNASADGFGTCSNNIEDQHNKSILDLARCKSSSDGIARALAAAYKACACPGFDSFLTPGNHDQAAGCIVSQAGGTVGSNMTASMVSMHTHCFMKLLHDVQVKGMEDLFLHVVRGEKLRGFTKEPWLSNGAPISALPSAAEDLNCTVCRVEYGSKSDLDRHVAGRKHASLVTRLHSRCQVCNVNCNSEKDYEKHVNGKKHASKVRLVQKRVAF